MCKMHLKGLQLYTQNSAKQYRNFHFNFYQHIPQFDENSNFE